MKRIFFLILTLGLLTSDLTAATTTMPRSIELEALTPNRIHERATQIIVQFMADYHYKKTRLDDAMSSAILDRYLEALDPNRLYFVQEDIAKFAKYRDKLDDALESAHLQPAFEIFKAFRNRLDERGQYAKHLLQDYKFDFDTNEELIVDRSKFPWAADKAALDEVWRKRVKNDALNLRLAKQSKEEIVNTLNKRYESLVRQTHQLDADDVFQIFINSYTNSIEPHTAYFSPRTSEDFKIRMSLSLEGIGAVLQADGEYTTVQQVVAGGPAAKSGKLKAQDRIIAVAQGDDGELTNVIGWRLDDVVSLIRGAKGSIVRLQVMPKGAVTQDTAEIIKLTRDTIKLEEQAAKKSILEIGSKKARIGVINLPSFYMDFAARTRGDKNYRSTTRDVQKLVEQLSKEKVEGIVIDLRGNGGGSLSESTDLTGLFIEKGPVVQVKDAAGHLEINADDDPKIAYTGPLAVLVDRQSASASEIFAGAIQDYHRGIIIGEPTFGKGTVQNLVELDRISSNADGKLGELKATVAQFFRVSGSSTQHRGVTPDITFPTALHSTDEGERAQKNALPWDKIEPVKFVPAQAPIFSFGDARKRFEERIKHDTVFKLLLEEAETYHQMELRNRVSLQEATRKKERDQAEQLHKEREKQFRLAHGLAPKVENVSDTDKLEKLEKEEKEGKDNKPPEVDDVLLYEAANILHDLIDISKEKAVNTLHRRSALDWGRVGIARQ